MGTPMEVTQRQTEGGRTVRRTGTGREGNGKPDDDDDEKSKLK